MGEYKEMIIKDWTLQCRKIKKHIIIGIYERINSVHEMELKTLEQRVIVYDVINMFVKTSSQSMGRALLGKDKMFSHGYDKPSEFQRTISNMIYENIKEDVYEFIKKTSICL